MLTDFRERRKGGEREQEGEREREINQMPPICTQTGDQTYNLGACPTGN